MAYKAKKYMMVHSSFRVQLQLRLKLNNRKNDIVVKIIFSIKYNAAPPAKFKVASMGPQNGQWGLPLGFWALPSTFAK